MSEFNENNQEFAPENASTEIKSEPAPATEEPQFFNEGAEVVSGVEVAKKGAGRIVAVIVAVIVLLFGCCAASYAFIPQVKNTVKMLINSPAEYYAWVENENVSCVEDVFDELEDFEYNVNSDINVSLDPQTIAELQAESGETGFMPESFNISQKATEIDGYMAMNQVMSMNDTPLMTYNIYLKDGKIYYQIPELSSSYLCIDFAEIYDLAAQEAEDPAALEMISGLLTDMQNGEELITNDELKNLILKYTDMLFSSAENVELVKDVACEADGVKSEYTKLVVNVDEGMCYTFAKKAVKELRNEEVVIRIAEKLGVSKEEYQSAIDSLSEQLGTYEVSGGEAVLVMGVYVNSKGEIVGREFTTPLEEDLKIGYTLTNDGDKYGFNAYVNADGTEQVAVNGNATEKSGKLTGEATLKAAGQDMLGVSFKDFETEDEITKGTLTLDMSALSAMAADIDGETAGFDDMTCVFDEKDGKQLVTMDMTYGGKKIATCEMTASNEKPDSITVFTEDAKVYGILEAEQYANEIDVEGFAKKLSESFGITEEEAAEFVQGFVGGMTSSLADEELTLDEVLTESEDDFDMEFTDEDFSDEDPYAESTANCDLSKAKIQINGKDVTLPGKVDGVLDKVTFEEETIEPDYFAYAFNDEYTITASVYNSTDKPLKPAECDVTGVSASEGSGVEISVDGFTFGDDIAKVAEKYGHKLTDTDTGFLDLYDEVNYSYVTFFYEGGKIYEIDLSF